MTKSEGNAVLVENSDYYRRRAINPCDLLGRPGITNTRTHVKIKTVHHPLQPSPLRQELELIKYKSKEASTPPKKATVNHIFKSKKL